MSDFDQLLALALVGTTRGTLPTPTDAALADVLNAMQGDPEGVLLSRAALVGMVRFAGRTAAPSTVEAPAPAPTETLPVAPARVVRHLHLVIDTPQLMEWLKLCAAAGWRVPPHFLPALLDRARYDTDLREKLRPVLGERGGWLAGFNPDWRFAPQTFSEEAWHNATEAGRESLFRTLRASDPAAAREWLINQFKSERAGGRKRLLSVLSDTWQAEDSSLEPLLEEALTDRSGEVHGMARFILQSLPTSAYNARMGARAVQLIQLEKTETTEQKYSLHLPPPDPDLKRDGFDEKPSTQTYLSRIIGHTHPDVLLSALQVSPVKLVILAKTFDVLDELVRVTQRFNHLGLAEALLKTRKRDLDMLVIVGRRNLLPTVWDALKEHDQPLLHRLIDDLPTPWPVDLSSAIISAMYDSMRNVASAWHFTMQSKVLLYAHPDASVPSSVPDDLPGYVKQTMQELTATLELRRQMLRDFEEVQR